MTLTYHRETHHSKCSVFAFGFETCNKTISSLIYRLINKALLVADHILIRCHFSSWTYLAGFWCSCVSVSVCVSTGDTDWNRNPTPSALRRFAPPCLARGLRPLHRPSLCVVGILRYFRPWNFPHARTNYSFRSTVTKCILNLRDSLIHYSHHACIQHVQLQQ